ncbi:hypothetical protein [Sphingomonas lenta]|nr:hypothetical protein [Sphingomonas lenta]
MADRPETRSAWLGLAERHPEASGAAEVRTLLNAPHVSDLQADFVEALSE